MTRAYMPMWWGDYLRDTGHLTTRQHGAYLLLIAHCWQHGVIPRGDDRALMRITHLASKSWHTDRDVVLPFFNPDGSHKRVLKELVRMERWTLRGKLAAKKRWSKGDA